MQHLEDSGAIRHIYVIRQLKVKNPYSATFFGHVKSPSARLQRYRCARGYY